MKKEYQGEKFIVLINSIISGSPGTIYHPETRFIQTLKTITTVIQKLGDCYIVLEEISDLSKDFEDILYQTGVNCIYKHYSTFVQRGFLSAHKTMGELYLINHGLNVISDLNPSFDTIVFKMGGRNYLDDNFNISHHIKSSLNIKKNPENEDYYFCAFSFSCNLLTEVKRIFNECFENNNYNRYLENGFYWKLKRENLPINELNILGVSGTFSMTGKSYQI